MPSIRTQRRWCGSSCIPFKPVLMESCCFQIINSQQHKKKKKNKAKSLSGNPPSYFWEKKLFEKQMNIEALLMSVTRLFLHGKSRSLTNAGDRWALPLGSFVFYTCVLISTCFYVSCIWWFSSLTDVSAFHVWEHWEGLSPVMRLIRRGW